MKKVYFLTIFIFLTIFNFNLGAKDVVYWVPQFSEFEEISQSDLLFLKKTIQKAEKNNAKAVICELDTPGGRIDIALRYLSIFAKSEVPIIVYLNPQGISAGMIIALGADQIAINPLGVIGDAMPMTISFDGATPIVEKSEEKPSSSEKLDNLVEDAIQNLPKTSKDDLQNLANQKFLTVYFKLLQVLAEKNNRPVEVIRATSDPYTVLTLAEHGIDHKGNSPLTLSAEEAKKLNIVDYIAKDRNDLLAQLNLSNAEVQIITPSPWDQIINFLTHSAVSGILIALGLIGIFIEIKTPGFGIAGTIGLLCLILFFLGHIYSGASEWGPLVVFFVGLILLLLEIFVIPGFGLVGILGIICIVTSLITAFGLDRINSAVQIVALALTGSITAMILLAIYVLPKTPLFRKLRLESVSGDTKNEVDCANQVSTDLLGKVGIAVTPLRPNGKIKIGDEIFEAVSTMEFINNNTPVKVIGRTSFELKVAPISETENC